MTLPNIALTGAMRSGKDAVAAYLTSKYGYTRFAFGDGLKDVCRRLYPDQFADGRKPRSLLQCFGQDARKYDPNVWVRECFRRIDANNMARHAANCDAEQIVYGPVRAVISDLRQPSEYERCRSEGYVIIRINAPDELRLQRAKDAGDTFTSADLAHETESYVDTFSVNYDVYNVGTLDELYAQIDAIMAKYSAENEKGHVE